MKENGLNYQCCSWLLDYYFFFLYISNNRDMGQLEELKVIIKGKYRTSRDSDPIKIYFNTKEYSNPFGIEIGGVYGRWKEVEKSLADSSKINIKIRKIDMSKLSNTNEAISIYYLNGEKEGLIFNEKNFDEGKNSYFKNVTVFLSIAFVFLLWVILRK